MTEQTRPAAPRIAYFVSEYPATSHTFILREVLGLRQRGFEIATASINADSRPQSAVTAQPLPSRFASARAANHPGQPAKCRACDVAGAVLGGDR